MGQIFNRIGSQWGGDRIMGAETSVHNELAEVGRFVESDRRRFSEEVLG